MPTISLAIQKGGSGKTTTAVNLPAALQQMGHSVLLIDLDPQANLTQALGILDEVEPSIYDLFQQEASGKRVDLTSILTERSGLPLIPASLELASAEMELVSIYGREQLLSRMLRPFRKKYDFIFIDCPPALGMLTVNALVASDYVLMPLQAEFLPLKGVKSFLRHFDGIKKTLNKNLKILGFVLTKYDQRKVMNRNVLDQLIEEHGDKVFDTRIRTNIALAAAQEAGVDIFNYSRTSNGALDYMELAHELIAKMRR
ncbi:MAG: ParA family protein [Lewinellaceae bacterium]|nr:ParA family protein [Phaeodactylibacter sp.]MCB9041721.1 ParA family protein [Lewinellaceae bacterium]